MKVLTVFAHPDRQSFCGAVLDRFTHGLAASGHRGEVADLFTHGFAYRLTAEGWQGDVRGRIPLLQHRKALLISTTFFGEGVYEGGAKDAMERLIDSWGFRYPGIRTVEHKYFWAVPNVTPASLSALPSPTRTATLIDTGVFGLVRHPMYSGAICAVMGCGLWGRGILMLAYAVLLAVLFDRKASREEQAFAEVFPAYAAYKRRVRKLVPFVY